MLEKNPQLLVSEIRDTLQRYIPTTLPIRRRYKKLSEAFEKLLAQQELVKGPYIEALPDFEKGASLRKLLKSEGGFLSDAFNEMPVDILDRPLHQHQEQAMHAASKEHKSLLVATGTGSGKTETFLYPIANMLLDDEDFSAPGVRCLLIYPMNALANDQLYYRIAPLFGHHLKNAGITFGRFTSQIKANTKRSEEESRLRDNDKLMKQFDYGPIPENWLLTREEMLNNPPKVLITNYAMLEHLLLLPRNARLFQYNRLKCIVLDEIHTYFGAQATEVAYLLRKLKNRLNITDPLQVFGTSASLAEGENADKDLTEFASSLFGEEVNTVVRGKRVPHTKLLAKKPSFTLPAATWIKLGQALDRISKLASPDREAWATEIERCELAGSLPALTDTDNFSHALLDSFSSNKELRHLASLLDKRSILSFTEVAEELFASEQHLNKAERYEALTAVMHLGMMARTSEDSFPLLPTRYHIVVNTIEGLSVKIDAKAEEGWSHMQPFRHYMDKSGLYYSLLVCRRCGQPFFEGYADDAVLHTHYVKTDNTSAKRSVFWLGTPPESFSEDEEDDQGETATEEFPSLIINPANGEIVHEETTGHKVYEIATSKDDEESKYYVKKCPACGAQAQGADAEIITNMHPGNEAVNSVVVQQVLDFLPDRKGSDEHLPLNGTNLLTFSDNRQDAAFFAPYFERTGNAFALRTAIYSVLAETDEPLDFEELFKDVYKHWSKNGLPVMIDEYGDIQKKRSKMKDLLIGKIAAEFCTPMGRRNSLEALGAVRVTYESDKYEKLIKAVKQVLPDKLKDKTNDVLSILLETIRRQQAVCNVFDVPLDEKYIWGIPSPGRSFEPIKANSKVTYAWLPAEDRTQHNRRTWYFVEQLALPWEDTRVLLQRIWSLLLEHKILLNAKPGYALDGEIIALKAGDAYELFECITCGLLQPRHLMHKCTAFKCRGSVRALSEEERTDLQSKNHYLYSYAHGKAATVRAREHTASLSTEMREEIEKEFSSGMVNVLSCTTTMEMGVDLGDLESVVCLNVPPNMSNYQQRTGRAGRRAQASPVCVTVARDSLYDQAVFRSFYDYLREPIPAPFLHLENAQLFQRHQYSILLSGLLKDRIKDLKSNAPSISTFLGEEFSAEAFKKFNDELLGWFDTEEGLSYLAEAENLASRLPADKALHIALKGQALINAFLDIVINFVREVSERWTSYQEKKDEEFKGGNATAAARWEQYSKKYMNQFLVNELSRRGMIPTYSFPVNSLTLEVTSGKQNYGYKEAGIALTRDASMGISEYAPGAEVVANGRIWKSAGLAYYPRQFTPLQFHTVCTECNYVDIGIAREDMQKECSRCGNLSERIRSFIEPTGFITAYEDRKGKDMGMYRKRQRPADEARLISQAPPSAFETSDFQYIQTALMRAHRQEDHDIAGTMFIVNRGPYGMGYHQCLRCNFFEPATAPKKLKKAHKNPRTGYPCDSYLEIPIDLAHTFHTDIRLLRFTVPLKVVRKEEAKDQVSYDAFCRTLTEALRFGAARLLHIQMGEIRGTYRIFNNQYVEIVLYDTVPGGAGYVYNLGQPKYPLTALIEKAVELLECTDKCSESCRSCLCDYSNQRYWDLFERQPVLVWLKELMQTRDRKEHPWEKPSLAALSTRLDTCNELYVMGNQLFDKDGADEKVIKWVLNYLNDGGKLHLYMAQPLEHRLEKLNASQRAIVRYLSGYIEDQRLMLYRLNIDIDKLGQLPRIAAGLTLNSPAWYTDFPVPPILNNLLQQPIYEKVLDKEKCEYLNKALKVAVPYPQDLFTSSFQIVKYDLVSGAVRNLPKYFEVLKDAHVETFTIKDPYCGQHTDPLKQFISQIKELPKEFKKIRVITCEQNPRANNHQNNNSLKDRIKKLESSMGDTVLDAVVQRFNGSVAFHDRSLNIQIINTQGSSEEHIYDLTAGIDYLMDRKKGLKIFHYKK